VSWPVTKWALPPNELSPLAGYRRGSGARGQDITDARALLDAMRADGREPPASLTLSAATESESETGLAALIAAQVTEALGIDVAVNPMPLAELAAAATSGSAPWLVAPDTGWLDLDDWVFPYFHSSGTRNTFAMRHTTLDGLLERQRAEFNGDARRQLGYEIQRLLLQINPGVNIASERNVTLSWPYVRDFPLDVTDGYQDRFASCWIDTDDPLYRPR
jgi:ABC-type transport system substrate-binding protein